MQVVPHPKLKRYYRGRTVRTTRELTNGYVSIPKGSIAAVTGQTPPGSTLVFQAWSCCSMKPIISRIAASDIEFVEPPASAS
jgi:hypothetical protein